MDKPIILGNRKNLSLVTISRGGTFKDSVHRLFARYAADCAQHLLYFFEEKTPNHGRPLRAIEQAHAWALGEITMSQERPAAFAGNADARETFGADKGHPALLGRLLQPPIWLHKHPFLEISATIQVAWSASGSWNSCLPR